MKMERRKFPSGVRFDPSDEELVVEYLDKKLKRQPLPSDAVKECYHIYGDKCPWEVFDKNSDDDYFYVFTKLNRIGSAIPSSASASGLWKHLFSIKAKNNDGSIQWSKRKVVFIEKGGAAHRHVHGHWFLDEFSLLNQTVDDYVLCKIRNVAKDAYKKKAGSRENPIKILDGSDEVEAVIAPSEDEIQCNHELPAANTSNVLPEERTAGGAGPSREYASYQWPYQ